MNALCIFIIIIIIEKIYKFNNCIPLSQCNNAQDVEEGTIGNIESEQELEPMWK